MKRRLYTVWLLVTRMTLRSQVQELPSSLQGDAEGVGEFLKIDLSNGGAGRNNQCCRGLSQSAINYEHDGEYKESYKYDTVKSHYNHPINHTRDDRIWQEVVMPHKSGLPKEVTHYETVITPVTHS